MKSSAGKSFNEELLSWFDRSHREMPWRHTGDPYKVLVSEIMLQQTRVATVVEYFQRWVERFPDVGALARAPEEEVLELWAGLGYYRRARNLHRAAGVILEEFGGEIPREVDALRSLPGVGPYTAGAVASIAFGAVEPLVDGNVNRVLTRLYRLEGDPGRGETKKEIWRRAGEMVDGERPGDFNQALMELGSEICRPRSPDCEGCPVVQFCGAYQAGDPEDYPDLPKRKEPKAMRGLSCVVWRRGEKREEREFLLRRRPAKGLLAGLWEFPAVEQDGGQWPSAGGLKALLLEVAGEGREVTPEGPVGTEVEHVFSHRRLRVRIFEWMIQDSWEIGSEGSESWRWVRASQLKEVAASALLKKIEQGWRQGTLLGQSSS